MMEVEITHTKNSPNRTLPPKLVKSVVRSERLKFQSCPKDLMESLDKPSDPNCNAPAFPTSDSNVESRADTSMLIPGISDGVKEAWLLDAADEGLTAISDDMALPVAPACGASGTLLSTTMLQQHMSNITRVKNVDRT